MAEEAGNLQLDQAQVKKAVQCLLAYLKSTSSKESLLLNEGQPISLLFTLLKIPKKEQTIRIPLPHGIRVETGEVCLFTRDEPNMTPEQTERFYKKMLREKGVKHVTEVMPLKVLKKEYKPFEAKRRLLGNYDLFLADARIRRLLPSLIGKHFYESKKVPLSVNLASKQLAVNLERLIQGSTLSVSKKGSCCMARVAHSGMTAEEVLENIVAAVGIIAAKLPNKGKSIKIIHLKSQSSMALPIFTTDLSHLSLFEQKEGATLPKKMKGAHKSPKNAKKNGTPAKKRETQQEEEIPELVPIVPSKKAKHEPVSKEGLEKAPKTQGAGASGKKATAPKTPKRVGMAGKSSKKAIATSGKRKVSKFSKGSKAPVQKLRKAPQAD